VDVRIRVVAVDEVVVAVVVLVGGAVDVELERVDAAGKLSTLSQKGSSTGDGWWVQSMPRST